MSVYLSKTNWRSTDERKMKIGNHELVFHVYGAANKIFIHEANAAYSCTVSAIRLGSARHGAARRGAIACIYAKVLSKRRLSHRPFPEDIGIYSIILIRALSRVLAAFAFLQRSDLIPCVQQ